MSKKQSNCLIFLCWLIYAFSYLGRYNYSATLVRIVDVLEVSRAEAGMVASFFFFAYAAGQLFNGMMNRYYKPRWIISAALLASAGLNLAMPLVHNIHVMKVLWMLNGFSLSVLWTTLIRVLGLYLDSKMLKKAVLVMGTTTASGTVLSYLFGAVFIRFFDWEWAFYSATIFLIVIALVWFVFYGYAVKDATPVVQVAIEKAGGVPQKKRFTKPMLILFGIILIFGVINNLIRDGLTTWTPSIFNDFFKLPQSYSILLTIGLPLLSVFGAWVCVFVNRYVRDHVLLCGVFYIAGGLTLLAFILLMPYRIWWVSLILIAIAALAMSSVNNVITSLMPLQMRNFADSGRIAGLTNTFCYIGATISSYSLGALSDSKGWGGVFYLLFFLSVAAILISGIYQIFCAKYNKTSFGNS